MTDRIQGAILGVIPAREGSKGIPKKNLREFLGTPLVARTLDHALDSEFLTHVTVTTDSTEIARLAEERGVPVVHRPAALAGDHVPMMPVVDDAVRRREEDLGILFEAIVILQPTSPLRRSADIDGAIRALGETGADCVVSVSRSQEHPFKSMRIVDGVLVRACGAEPQSGLRQVLPETWRRNGAVYVLRREKGFDPDPVRQPGVYPYIMPVERSVDIDELIDFEYAEWLANRAEPSDSPPPAGEVPDA